jgi:hypothetical protein
MIQPTNVVFLRFRAKDITSDGGASVRFFLQHHPIFSRATLVLNYRLITWRPLQNQYIMGSTSGLRQRMETTTRAFLSAFEEGSTQQDASIINRDVTADCTRNMHPASVPQAFGLPADFVFDTNTFQAAYAKDIKAMRFENNIISNLIIDVEASSAAFTSIATVRPNKGEAYENEQAWFLYFAEDGSKVKIVVEFCDKDAILRMAKTSA